MKRLSSMNSVVGLAAALSLTATPWSQAQTVWYVNLSAAGADDGTSWADAYDDLHDALDAAGSGDEIWVATGAYEPDRGTGDRTATFQLN